MPKKRLKLGAPLRPNVGCGEVYRKRLNRLIDEMNNSILYWVTARFREASPTAKLAMDESWMGTLTRTIEGLAKRWTDRFDEAAEKLAEYFAKAAADRPTNQLAEIMADSGMTVDFRMSRAMKAAKDAIVTENVNLIKSIAAEHLTDVKSIVLRSVTEGRKLDDVTKLLRARFDVPKKRAALIARDQNNKATAAFTKIRQQEAGITQAIWVHSHAGKKPRPEHLAFSRGQLGGPVYDVNKGAYLEGKWTWPGMEINCRCFCRPVIPGF